jgi:RNA polymerase sigma factor (sigma-70 family)
LPAFHGMVRSSAHEKAPKGKHRNNQTFGDSVSAGLLGLWDAVRKFDFRGRFSTYARRRIEGEIAEEAARQRYAGRRAPGLLNDWIADHLGATPQELFDYAKELVAAGRLALSPYQTLEQAQDALDEAYAAFGDAAPFSDDVDGDADDDTPQRATKPGAAAEELHTAFNPRKQSRWHNRVSPLIDYLYNNGDDPRVSGRSTGGVCWRPSENQTGSRRRLIRPRRIGRSGILSISRTAKPSASPGSWRPALAYIFTTSKQRNTTNGEEAFGSKTYRLRKQRRSRPGADHRSPLAAGNQSAGVIPRRLD